MATDEPKFQPDDEVTISYFGYTVEAKILRQIKGLSYSLQKPWWMVEEICNSRGNDYTDKEEYPNGGPTYEAAEEYIVKKGDKPAPGPFSRLFNV